MVLTTHFSLAFLPAFFNLSLQNSPDELAAQTDHIIMLMECWKGFLQVLKKMDFPNKGYKICVRLSFPQGLSSPPTCMKEL